MRFLKTESERMAKWQTLNVIQRWKTICNFFINKTTTTKNTNVGFSSQLSYYQSYIVVAMQVFKLLC